MLNFTWEVLECLQCCLQLQQVCCIRQGIAAVFMIFYIEEVDTEYVSQNSGSREQKSIGCKGFSQEHQHPFIINNYSRKAKLADKTFNLAKETDVIDMVCFTLFCLLYHCNCILISRGKSRENR